MASRTAPKRAARTGRATSVSRVRNRGRSALSQSAVRDEKFFAALRLHLPELQREISARPPNSPRHRVSRLLPKTQRRRFRSAVSAKTHDEVVAVFVSKTELNKQALGTSASTTLVMSSNVETSLNISVLSSESKKGILRDSSPPLGMTSPGSH